MRCNDRKGPEMYGHMGWTELMNQMILWTESEMEMKDYCKDIWVVEFEVFVCKKTKFVFNALFDRKPV